MTDQSPTLSAEPPAEQAQCPACNGNDRDAPCAYPSEGKPGCLRDKRLAQSVDPLVARLTEWLHRWPGGAPNEVWSVVSDIVRAGTTGHAIVGALNASLAAKEAKLAAANARADALQRLLREFHDTINAEPGTRSDGYAAWVIQMAAITHRVQAAIAANQGDGADGRVPCSRCGSTAHNVCWAAAPAKESP